MEEEEELGQHWARVSSWAVALFPESGTEGAGVGAGALLWVSGVSLSGHLAKMLGGHWKSPLAQE